MTKLAAVAFTALVCKVSAGPELERVLGLAINSPEQLVEELRASPLAAIASFSDDPPALAAGASADGVPLVFAHGMGDSCFNGGMKQITSNSAAHVGSYGVCIGNGNNVL